MCQQHGVVFCSVRSTVRNTNVIATRSAHTQEARRKQSFSFSVEVQLHATSAPIPDIKETNCVDPISSQCIFRLGTLCRQFACAVSRIVQLEFLVT